MARSSIALVLALAAGTAAAAEPAAPRVAELRLVFASADGSSLSGGAGSSDVSMALGTLSAGRARTGTGVTSLTRRRVALTVQGGAGAPAFVRLSAHLQADDGRSRIRVAGLRLSSLPQVVAQRVRVGSPAVFDIEVEVPGSAPEGPLFNAIGWIAEGL